MKNIAVLENNQVVIQRIKKIMESINTNVLEASRSENLVNKIRTSEYTPNFILLDINLQDEDGFVVMTDLKRMFSDIPIIIMTSEARRSMFVKGVQLGAIDYILKPFNDDELKTRLSRHLEYTPIKSEFPQESHIFNFQNYLKTELKKADKGGYSIATVMITFFKPVSLITEALEQEYLILGELFYKKIRETIWDTDAIVKYGSQSIFGIFPFVDSLKAKSVIEKIEKTFDEFKKMRIEMKDYQVSVQYVISPSDGNNKEELIELLTQKTYQDISSKKNSAMKKLQDEIV